MPNADQPESFSEAVSFDQSTESVQSNPPPGIVSGSTVTPSIRKSSRIRRPPNRYAPTVTH